ncbi:uncharacterized protein LOC117788330 isoform X2 [Drosophila innubila]|uniref:uncharacterized protein LOC117788330 isoform X2 n=1 Tax=Drosophila innubila TaxID=198719 RepID=UPI00148E5B9C|nr:uncharacterized protein LOC117788330 isoform X2 [Drosophila innubila]
MMSSTARNNCINVDETVAAAAGGAATTTTVATTAAAMPEFVQLNETRRYIYRVIAAIHDESFNKLMNGLLRQFECAIREEFENAQNSPLLCRKLARNIIALTDQIYTVQQRHSSNVDNSVVYRQRICFIVAIYIACELCAAQDRVENHRCILERISSTLGLYVEDADVGCGAHKEYTLLTLVAIPKVFGQANIISVLYSRLFPQWSMPSSFFTQIELPDKIYIEYIIIFYCWQRLERDEATRQRIIEFAAKFMRPSSTLPFNSVYINHLPDYGASRTATRCILEHLNVQQACTGLRAASRIDNRSQAQSNDLIFDSDEEKEAAESGLVLASTMAAAAITLPITPLPPPAPDPPDFLKVLCENAILLEPVRRVTALYRGIDSTREVVDICESDDDEEMFSLHFSVPANVDGNASSSNEASATVEDDYVPITRIFPSNLRTYQRATSSATNVAAPATNSTETYTMPRIVNSYSCRRDSLHLVSTTQTPPHLVDQCVQTADQKEDQHQQQHQRLSFDDDAISTCRFYSDDLNMKATDLISAGSSSNRDKTIKSIGNNHHCQQPSSRNSNSSEASMIKKQVTFSAEHLSASRSAQLRKSHRSIKPSIKPYRDLYNTTPIPLTPTSSMDHVETLKWLGRKEHLQAGQRMFSKLEDKKYCDKRTTQSLSSGGCRKRLAPTKRPCITPTTQLTPTTSNASSGTPTPQPRSLQSRAQQRSLPTPPASTHSSSGTILHGKPVCSLDIDINRLQAESSSYKFNRRKFTDTSKEHVRFCNKILELQRIKMKEKRKTQPKPSHRNVEIQNRQKIKRLITLNAKLRQHIDKLESDMTIITNYAMEEQTKAAILPKFDPVVRLKRIHVKELIIPHRYVDENTVNETTHLYS